MATITGGTSNDTLAGGSADDTINGNAGNDSISGGDGDDALYGDAGNDVLDGGKGIDMLDGGSGADTMSGGEGDDSYYVDDANDVVVEQLYSGKDGDSIYSSIASYVLPANVENGYIQLDTAANITGNTLANKLYAGLGDNVISGGGGNDWAMYTYGYGLNTSGVTVNLSLTGPQDTVASGRDTLIDIKNIMGTYNADTLTGDAGDNMLYGEGGNDTLSGGDGQDTLDGGGGSNTLIGGNGNDFYNVLGNNDVVIETNSDVNTGGRDTVYSYADSYTLPANVEIGAIKKSGATSLTGNALDNLIYDGPGNNAIDGAAGIDTVVFTANKQNYQITKLTSTTTVHDNSLPASSKDTLSNIERLRFLDSSVAYDLDGNAGNVAKILGAVFGKAMVANLTYAGIGLHYTDIGLSYEALMQLALNTRLGTGATNRQVVDLIYTNVIGSAPPEATAQYYVGLLANHTFTPASLAVMAADTVYNTANINLVGLAQTGLAYTEYAG